jgi:hypothetical protein
MTDTEKVGPVDHISRAILPWRSTADLTECGKDVASYPGRIVTREEAAARIKRIGQRRSMFSLCMTCVSTSDRYRSRYTPVITEDIVMAVARAASSVQHSHPPYPGEDPSPTWRERQRLAAEFEAIIALIAAHREEFDGYLSGREQTVSLADRRRQRRAGGE